MCYNDTNNGKKSSGRTTFIINICFADISFYFSKTSLRLYLTAERGVCMLKKERREDTAPLPDYEVLFREEADSGERISFRFFVNLWKKHIGMLIRSTLLFIAKHSAFWLVPIITANIINLATEGGENALKGMLINFGVLCVFLLANIPLNYLYANYVSKTLRTISAGMRSTLIRKLQHLSITYYKDIETGRVQSKFIRDIEMIETLNRQFISVVIHALISVVFGVIVALCKSPMIAPFFLFVIPVNVTVARIFRKKMKLNNSELRRQSEQVSTSMTNMMELIPVTKAHGLENQEIENITGKIAVLKDKGVALDVTNEFFASIIFVLTQLMSCLCLIYSGWLAYTGKIHVGDIVVFQSYFSMVTNNVNSLVNILPEMSKGFESIRSISEIVLSDDIEDNRNKIKLRYVHGTVYFDNVSYKYPGAEEDVIKDVTLHVEPGECIAFVGASGSGKSTVMNMIIGFLKATGGCVSIDGKPIQTLNLSDYRKHISVVPQTSILFPGSIKDNIVYGLKSYTKEELDRALEMANINEFAKDLPNGIDTIIGEHGDKLSGGQKQRISIARAIIRNPKIIILDEATSALDNISEYQVQKAISSLIKDRTTFIVAHRLSTIRDADRIVVMEKGKIAEMGTYYELMEKKGRFYELKSLSDLNETATLGVHND